MYTYYNLTQPQMSIWETDQFYKGTPISNIGGTLLLTEDIDFSLLKIAINKFVEKNDAMRTRLKVVESIPFQYIIPYEYFPINYYDFTGWSKEAEDAWLTHKTEVPFSIYNEPLYRFDMIKSHDGRCGYMVVIHHIICDGWTNALKFEQTMTYYAKLTKNMTIDSTTNPSYIDYIIKEKAYLKSDKFKEDQDFWMARYEEKPIQASIKLKDKENHNRVAKRKRFTIDGDLAKAMHTYSEQHNVSTAVIMEGIIGVYASRFHDLSEMTIGIPVLNRSGATEKSTVGMFVNTLPVEMSVDEQSDFLYLCKSISNEHMEVFRHRRYPMNQLLADIRKKHHINHNFYDICVSYSNGKIKKTNHDYEFSSKWYFCGTQPDSLYLHIDDRDDKGTFVLLYDYLVTLFSEDEIEQLHRRIVFLLKQCLTLTELNICDLELSEIEERERLLNQFNDTYAAYPKNKCYHQCFEEQVVKTPNEIAVIYKEQSLTYDKLSKLSNQLAAVLYQYGVKRSDVVGIMINRCEWVFIAQLAILKSGGCYLPIDPNYPQDRVHYMLEDSGAKVIITTRQFEFKEISIESAVRIYIEDIHFEAYQSETPQVVASTEDCAYLIYTSGSTGKPKGAMVSHRGLVNFCTDNQQNLYGGCITSDLKRIISVSSISFDMFVTESLVPLMNGMTVIMADEETQNTQSKLNALVVEHDIEVLITTPTRMKLLLMDSNALDYLMHLKVIQLGGEDFTPSLYRQLRKLTQAKLWNGYGPTETTVMCSQIELTSDCISMGKPISNTQIYIVDKHMKLVPTSVIGEIYVGGDGVGLGYYNQRNLTRERFLDNPYSVGKQFYKTGDLGAWDQAGNIHHHGRNDYQVKINGLRIELGEIENAMLAIGSINCAAVTVVEDRSQKQSLCGYYVSDSIIANESFHTILKALIPGYMIPLYYMKLDEFPVMPCGKVDVQKLPIPVLEEINNKVINLPRNEIEIKLAAILSEVLEIENISIDDHIFYELGGDSFVAIQIQFLAEKAGLDLEINDLYQYPSIREISENLFNKVEEHHYEDEQYTSVFGRVRPFTEIQEMKSVLLTGASGFLGAHLLVQLLDQTESEVICLVRCKKRLLESLEYYFGTQYTRYMNRVILIEGDIEKSRFGLGQDVYGQLMHSVTAVFHTAANVRHFGIFEEFYKTNVQGTQEVIEFCIEGNAILHHVSTISVSGDGVVKQNHRKPEFTESSLYIGQNYKDNIYIHTKYLAEKEIIDALEYGLKACIYRVGNLMWRVSDGKFQKNWKDNGFINRMNAFRKLGRLPEVLTELETDITPIDQCAQAIVLLAKAAKEPEVYHLINHHKISFKTFLNKVNVNFSTVSFVEFFEYVRENREDDHIGVLYMYLNQMIAYYHEMDVEVRSGKTMKRLKALGFDWNHLSEAYLIHCPLNNCTE